MINWEEVKKEYETTKITLAKLAEKHDIPLGTIKSQKSRDTKNGNPWVRDGTIKDATKSKKVATIKKTEIAPSKEKKIVYSEEVLDNGLTERQSLFCMYYLKTFNQTMAAIKAGYAKNSAHVEGSRLLRNPKVAAEIRRLKEEMRKGIFVDAMDVLEKYVQIAFADITDYLTFGREEVQLIGMIGPVFDDDKKPIMIEQDYVRFNESIDVDGTLITSVKQGKDGISVQFADKMRALEFLSKHFDLLGDNERKKLYDEKLKAETDFAQMRAAKLRGDKKDTSKLDVLLEGQKQFEEMAAKGMFKQFEKGDGNE